MAQYLILNSRLTQPPLVLLNRVRAHGPRDVAARLRHCRERRGSRGAEYTRTRSTNATARSPLGPRRSVRANANGRYRGRPVDNRSAITSRCKHAVESDPFDPPPSLPLHLHPLHSVRDVVLPPFARISIRFALKCENRSAGAVLSFEHRRESAIRSASRVAFESRYFVGSESKWDKCAVILVDSEST